MPDIGIAAHVALHWNYHTACRVWTYRDISYRFSTNNRWSRNHESA